MLGTETFSQAFLAKEGSAISPVGVLAGGQLKVVATAEESAVVDQGLLAETSTEALHKSLSWCPSGRFQSSVLGS